MISRRRCGGRRRISNHPQDGWDDVILESVSGMRRLLRPSEGPRRRRRRHDVAGSAPERHHGSADGFQARYGLRQAWASALDRMLLLQQQFLSPSVVVFLLPSPVGLSVLRRRRRRRQRGGVVGALDGGQGHADGAGRHDDVCVRFNGNSKRISLCLGSIII